MGLVGLSTLKYVCFGLWRHRAQAIKVAPLSTTAVDQPAAPITSNLACLVHTFSAGVTQPSCEP